MTRRAAKTDASTHGKIEFGISREFDTITCGNCGWEYIYVIVLRADPLEPQSEDSFLDRLIGSNYCPHCGMKSQFAPESVTVEVEAAW